MNQIGRCLLIFPTFLSVTAEIAWASEVECSPPAALSQEFDSRPNLLNRGLETLYNPLTENISITPEAMSLTVRGQNRRNDDIVIEIPILEQPQA